MRLNKEYLDSAIFMAARNVDRRPLYEKLLPYADKDKIVEFALKRKKQFFEQTKSDEFALYDNPRITAFARNKMTSMGNDDTKDTEECNISIENFFKNHSVESLLDHVTDGNKFYMCCPECHYFAGETDWLVPLKGWDGILEEHASEIFARLLLCKLENDYKTTPVKSPEEDIALSITKEYYYKQKSDMYYCLSEYDYNVKKEEFKLADDGSLLKKCPHCGKEFRSNTDFVLGFSHEYHPVRLRRDAEWFTSNTWLVNYEIFENKENLVTVATIIWHLYPNVRGRLHVMKTSNRVTFNTKTGQTYLFREFDLEKKKPMWYEKDKPRIRNATYTYYSDPLGSHEIKKAALEAICRKKGIESIEETMDTQNIYSKAGFNNLHALAIINRYLEYGTDFISQFISIEDGLKKEQKSELFKMRTDHAIFKKYLKRYKVSGKKRIKMYAKNPILFFMDNALNEVGIKNNDIKLSLLENTQWIADFTEDVYRQLRATSVIPYVTRQFIKEYIALKSEAELGRKLSTISFSSMQDTADMYGQIDQLLVLSEKEKRTLLSGSLIEVHDRLSHIFREIRKEHFYIPYTKDELDINCRCSGYTFRLAKTSKELEEVGDKMHICVGSYGHRAFRKSCKIVVMREANNKLAACIELDPTGKHLMQFKDYCNDVIAKEKVAAAVCFLEKNNIDYKECHDAIRSGFIDNDSLDETDYEKLEETEGYVLFDSQNDFKKILLDSPEVLSFEDDLQFRFRQANNVARGVQQNQNNNFHYVLDADDIFGIEDDDPFF